MNGFWDRLRGVVARILPTGGRAATSADSPGLYDSGAALAPMVTCPACEGSGQCRVCGGAGTVDRLVAAAGADSSGFLAREPVHTVKTLKCRACPGSKGTCRRCQGRGVIPAPTSSES